MSNLKSGDFGAFFFELHKRTAFPWQIALAEQVCEVGWPEVIDLPTASGKTACLDIALFALAVKKQAARRIFFVVDRRVIVNEAYWRMCTVAKKLAEEKTGVIGAVAKALREMTGDEDADPLDVHEMRGGIYRDNSWVRSPLQPTVITSTVDQVGSRLLFRGYGVSRSSWPINAALIANDALIFLDEAHCSRAFAQTLGWIRDYRGNEWAEKPVSRPFGFIEMTATPTQGAGMARFCLQDADRKNEHMRPRLFTPKPTILRLETARPKDLDAIPNFLVEQAVELADKNGAKRIAVMVNRVATAKKTFDALIKKASESDKVHLLIGRMRPVDRDELLKKLEPLKAGATRNANSTERHFVVSTQCLEVGADLDFDVLVTECASIDALMQRFGRLDRLGELDGRARGCIMISTGAADPKDPDPIYGTSLKKAWQWLVQLGGDGREVNMGIEAHDGQPLTVAQELKKLPEPDANRMRRMGQDAPALMPAHLDALVQTSPSPYAEPDVALFLHGVEEGLPEVQVVWRADLKPGDEDNWKEIVSLCPPVSAEAMPVKLWEFRCWMRGAEDSGVADADLEGVGGGEETLRERTLVQEPRDALIWRGDKSKLASEDKVKPGDTLVLPLKLRGWEQFGYAPEPVKDVGDEAILKARRRLNIRLHPELFKSWPETSQERLTELLGSENADVGDWVDLLVELRGELEEADTLWLLIEVAKNKVKDLVLIEYPARAGEPGRGRVLQSRRLLRAEEDDGEDELSRRGGAVSLEEHTGNVKSEVEKIAQVFLPDFAETFKEVAAFHDAGKCDIRFQAMLHGGDHMAAAYSPKLLAKSEILPAGSFQSARERSGLPDGFRHELLSFAFARRGCASRADLDLILHLVATHHGYCRPLARIVIDPDAPDAKWFAYQVCKCERESEAAHRLDAGAARRFWYFTRQFGWWGSAYLETLFRLADWAASEREPKVAD